MKKVFEFKQSTGRIESILYFFLEFKKNYVLESTW